MHTASSRTFLLILIKARLYPVSIALIAVIILYFRFRSFAESPYSLFLILALATLEVSLCKIAATTQADQTFYQLMSNVGIPILFLFYAGYLALNALIVSLGVLVQVNPLEKFGFAPRFGNLTRLTGHPDSMSRTASHLLTMVLAVTSFGLLKFWAVEYEPNPTMELLGILCMAGTPAMTLVTIIYVGWKSERENMR